jgi:hypothetical protein
MLGGNNVRKTLLHGALGRTPEEPRQESISDLNRETGFKASLHQYIIKHIHFLKNAYFIPKMCFRENVPSDAHSRWEPAMCL